MNFEKGFAAIGAAIERMRDRGDLVGNDYADVVMALRLNVGHDTAVFDPSLADLVSELSIVD